MRRVVPLFLLAVLVAGCGNAKTVTVTTTQTVTSAEATGTITTRPPPKTTVRAYLLRDGKVAPVARSIYRGWPLTAALTGGPTHEERQFGFTTAVPDTWDANKLPRQGLAQLTYTLTQFDPSRPLHVLGRTWDRKDYEGLTPAILVESPLPFQAVSAPLRVTGTANTFEATFEYELLDPVGKVLSHNFVTATSGSGTRGTFDFTIPFEAPNGLGKLVVYESSAADGSRIHVVEIPLTLAR